MNWSLVQNFCMQPWPASVVARMCIYKYCTSVDIGMGILFCPSTRFGSNLKSGRASSSVLRYGNSLI